MKAGRGSEELRWGWRDAENDRASVNSCLTSFSTSSLNDAEKWSHNQGEYELNATETNKSTVDDWREMKEPKLIEFDSQSDSLCLDRVSVPEYCQTENISW